jgi:hypothetical protein
MTAAKDCVVCAMAQLILKRASASRPSGEWNDEDFGVVADGAVVGRIFKANAAPVGSSWMWTMPTAARLRWQHSPRASGRSKIPHYTTLGGIS